MNLLPLSALCEICGKSLREVAESDEAIVYVSAHYIKCLEGKLIKDQARLESEVIDDESIGDQDLCLPPT